MRWSFDDVFICRLLPSSFVEYSRDRSKTIKESGSAVVFWIIKVHRSFEIIFKLSKGCRFSKTSGSYRPTNFFYSMSPTTCALWATAQIDQPLFAKGFPESRLACVKVCQSGYAWWFWLRPHETLCCNKHHKLTWSIFGHFRKSINKWQSEVSRYEEW